MWQAGYWKHGHKSVNERTGSRIRLRSERASITENDEYHNQKIDKNVAIHVIESENRQKSSESIDVYRSSMKIEKLKSWKRRGS